MRTWIAALMFVAGPAVAAADDRGWGYLIDRLVEDGLPRERVVAAFEDPRVEPFVGLQFSATPPREPRSRYRRLLRPASINAARRCRARYAPAFDGAERQYGVPANVLAAILSIESGCGRNTGSQLVLHRLARLAMANEPANLDDNIARLAGDSPHRDRTIEAKVRARARYLEATFYPEVRALFAAADRMGVDPLAIRGSGSGAFGYPQFLPSSYVAYGVDADGDGRVSLYDPDDAVASCAHFFVGHGWRPGLSLAEQRAVVWQYNKSSAYADAVMTMASRIGTPGPARRGTVVSLRQR
ncbi:MAG TPA: lytic murein transglycosylase [Candidatus Binatia bacterium]|nr:lytic murein transglycosylase [Candidatus Binatia bacterium]